MVTAGDNERVERFVSRILFIAARRRWWEAQALAAGIDEKETAATAG